MPSPRSDSSPSPDESSPTPDPSPMTDLLFNPPTMPDPMAAAETETEQDPHSWPSDASASLSGRGDATGSEAPSKADLRRKARELLPMTTAAVETAGGIAHSLLTVEGTPEHAAGLYLPDQADVKAVAEPLAGLASRRMPEGAENPDVRDLVGLFLGLVGYVTKQMRKRAGLVRQEHLEEQYAGEADQETAAA
jgi:hypothetical protein